MTTLNQGYQLTKLIHTSPIMGSSLSLLLKVCKVMVNVKKGLATVFLLHLLFFLLIPLHFLLCLQNLLSFYCCISGSEVNDTGFSGKHTGNKKKTNVHIFKNII